MAGRPACAGVADKQRVVMNTFIIAEVACTWHTASSEMTMFGELVDSVAACGVQAIKTQWTSSPSRMALRRKMDGNPYYYLNWPEWWMPEMAKICGEVGIEFMCTAYLPEDVAIIDTYVKRHKGASLENGPNIRVL